METISVTSVNIGGLELKLRKIVRPLPQSDVSSETQNRSTTLVLFFGWLGAKPRALDNYFNLYQESGLDVLFIPGQAKLFVWPPSVDVFAKSLMELLMRNTKISSYDSFLVHGMSIGCYVFTCCLMKAYKHRQEFSPFVDKIKGVIMDSPTYGSFERMRKGVAGGLAKNPIVQAVVPRLLSIYFFFAWNYTVEFFEKAMHFLEEQPLNVPYAFFFSQEDPMCDANVISGMIENWREKMSTTVITRFWKKSVHAGHLRHHPGDYKETFNQFISVYFDKLHEHIMEQAASKSKL